MFQSSIKLTGRDYNELGHSSDMASKSSPEYQAALESYVNLIEYASLESGRLCDLLFGAKYLSTDVRKFIRDKSQQEMDKARKLIDTII